MWSEPKLAEAENEYLNWAPQPSGKMLCSWKHSAMKTLNPAVLFNADLLIDD